MRYKLPLWESSPKLAPDLRSVVQQGTLLAGGRCGLICDSWPPFERARRLPLSLSYGAIKITRQPYLGSKVFIIIIIIIIFIIIIIILIKVYQTSFHLSYYLKDLPS